MYLTSRIFFLLFSILEYDNMMKSWKIEDEECIEIHFPLINLQKLGYEFHFDQKTWNDCLPISLFLSKVIPITNQHRFPPLHPISAPDAIRQHFSDFLFCKHRVLDCPWFAQVFSRYHATSALNLFRESGRQFLKFRTSMFFPTSVGVQYRRMIIKGLLLHEFTIRRLMEVRNRGWTFH